MSVNVGELLSSDSPQRRDAIHVAIISVIAGERLQPGDRVGLADGSNSTVVRSNKGIGIADPFLPSAVNDGQRFWLFMFPNTITSISHNWTHPAFADIGDRDEAIRLIEKFADDAGISYDEMMEAADGYLHFGDYLSQGGRWEGHYLDPAFWDAYETVTGTFVPKDQRGSFFSCSC